MGNVRRFGNQSAQLAGSTGSQFTPGVNDNVVAERVQGGIFNNGSGAATLVFPRAFQAPPFVIATPVSGTNITVLITNITATGCTVNSYAGSTGAGSGGTFHWLAFGQE